MKKLIVIAFFFFLCNIGFSQVYNLSGSIKDSRKNEPLAFANIKVVDSSYGTTANQNGEYILKLQKGNYHLEVTYIGYISEDLYISIDSDIVRNILMIPSNFVTEEIKVFGEDPAYEIIKRAIEYKKRFKSKLNEYNYDAFSKYIIRSNIAQGDSSTEKGKLPILGILESETKGYFRKPDEEKQIVISKRETANISRGFALPLIVNFYDENVDFGDVQIPGPLNDNAFEIYEYKLIGTTALDSIIIYKISVKNTSNIKPQFYGTVYIIDSIFALKKIDLKSNEAGNVRGVNDIRFIQKFDSYKDVSKNIFWMPTDVEIFAKGKVLGLIDFEGEVFTIVQRYNLNEKAPEGTFDEFVVKVLPESEKDSTYWRRKSIIKNSNEENATYDRIEKNISQNKNKISFGLNTVNYGQYFYTNVFELYQFNRVQGHTGMFNLNYRDKTDKMNFFVNTGYGFADKNWLFDFGGRFSFLKDRSLVFNFNAYDKTKTLFKSQSWLSYAENVAYCWLLKKDRYDYYYGNGYNFQISKKIIPQFGLSIGFSRETQKSAINNSDFSLFSTSKEYRKNVQISDNSRSAINTGVLIDPNKYRAIDWGDGSISRFPITEYPSFSFNFVYSGNDIGSDYFNRKYSMQIRGSNSFAPFLNLKYKAGYTKYSGDVPFQDLGFFDISSFASSQGLVFYTLNYMEFLGDKLWYINIENDFGKYLTANIPFIRNLSFSAFLNAGKIEISERNQQLSRIQMVKGTDGIYLETGFIVGKIFELLKTTFSWRLNNFNPGSNFDFQLIFEGIF